MAKKEHIAASREARARVEALIPTSGTHKPARWINEQCEDPKYLAASREARARVEALIG
jgi:hypothetical protein